MLDGFATTADAYRALLAQGELEYELLKNASLNFILWRGVFEPAHFIMERKMRLGIKQRAEATLAV